MTVRRVVTGHNADGTSLVIDDSWLEPAGGLVPGSEPHQIWANDETATVPAVGLPRPTNAYFPPANGVRFKVVTFYPDDSPMDGTRPDQSMHVSDTVDYAFIASGTITLELDGGEEPFSVEEAMRAAEDRRDKQLAETMDVDQGPIRIRLSVEGKTVLENYDGSIRAYETRGQGAPAAQAITNFTISGPGFAGLVSIGDNNQVTQTNRVGSSELAQLISSVIDAAKGTEVEQRLNTLMAQLKLEAGEEEPDDSIVGKILDRSQDAVATVAAKTVGGALQHSLNQLVQYFNDYGLAQLIGLG